MSNGPLRIMLADDHEIVRRGIRTLLQTVPGWEVCCEVGDGESTMVEAIMQRPDILLLDVSMPPIDVLDVVRKLGETAPDVRILVFTMHESEELVRSFLSAGVRGYVLKSDADRYLISAIEAIADGKTFFSVKVAETIVSGFVNADSNQSKSSSDDHILTPREVEITKLLTHGRSNKEIAKALFISVKTVETHRRTIMHKLDISSIVDLVHWAIKFKLIEPAK